MAYPGGGRVRRVARISAAIIGAALIGGCGSAGRTVSQGAASCIPNLVYQGERYIGATLSTPGSQAEEGRLPRSHMREIGPAVIPACDDTNGEHDSDISLVVARIDHYSPGRVLADYATGNVYLAPGARLPRSLVTAHWIDWVNP
jgi:hypothetical protein